MYDHQSIVSLCDEYLGLCDHLKHTISDYNEQAHLLATPYYSGSVAKTNVWIYG